MFSCLQILEAFLWFVLITLLNVTLIILTLSVSRLLNLLLRLVAFLLFLNPQCLASISRWITASSSWKRFCLFVCRALSSIMVICMLTAIRLLLTFRSQSPMLGFHKQMDNRIKLLEEILSFRMQGVEFDNGDMYVDGHKAASDVRDEFVSVTEKLMDELAQCYNVLPQLDINNTIDHRPEGDEKWFLENEKTVTQFCRKLAAERPLKDIRDEYNYPKKKGIKDECSRLLEASTMKSRRGFAIQRLMIIPMLCVTIFVILVVWFLLPRVARLMIHTPTAISIFVCLSMVQLMAVFISMRCTLCGHFLQVALTLILVVGYAIAAS